MTTTRVISDRYGNCEASKFFNWIEKHAWIQIHQRDQ